MSARWRASARPSPSGPRARALALLTLVPLMGAVLVHAVSAADPPDPARRLDAAAARRAGVALEIVARRDLARGLVEVRPVAGSSASGIAAAGRLLDVTADGGAAAVAPGIGRDVELLVVAFGDGSQLQVPVEGLLDATFAPGGGWLAFVDGTGRLSRVQAADGSVQAVAEGPFVAAPVVEEGGGILALSVSSVDAPFRSHLVRVRADGSLERLTAEELVYGVQRLADGSLAVIAHRPSGTAVQRLAAGVPAPHADLGPDAVNVVLSRDGNVIAWQSGGQSFARSGAGPARDLGQGVVRGISADGTAALLERESGLVLVDLDGAEIAGLGRAAGFGSCGGCLP